MSRLFICTALAVIAPLLGGCHFDRNPVEPDDGSGEGITIEGQVRIPVDALEPPVWVLLAVDCSASMATNDPDGARVRAVEELLNAEGDRSAMRYGLVRIASNARVITARDRDGDGVPDTYLLANGPGLRDALDGLRSGRGGTSYLEALDLTAEALEGAIYRAAGEGLGKTRVRVILLSDDGEQPIDPDDPQAMDQLRDRVQHLQDLAGAAGLDDLRIHAVQLSDLDPQGVDPVPNREVLEFIAELGGGTYRQARLPADLSLLHVDLTPADGPVPVSHVRLVGANLNALPRPAGPRPDSDADGLVDVVEEDLGTDPLRPDSDFDGYPDGVEHALDWILDPLREDPCQDDTDSDGDGLLACVEELLRTDPLNPDTDADGLPDAMELWAGTEPLFPDADLPAGVLEADLSQQDDLITFSLAGLEPMPTLADGPNTVQLWLTWGRDGHLTACLPLDPKSPPPDGHLDLDGAQFTAPRACR